eukprot:Pgem_evm1s20173
MPNYTPTPAREPALVGYNSENEESRPLLLPGSPAKEVIFERSYTSHESSEDDDEEGPVDNILSWYRYFVSLEYVYHGNSIF